MLYSIFVLGFKNVKSTFSVKCHVFEHFDHNFYFTSSHEYALLLLWLCKCFQRHCNKSLVYLNNWKIYFKSRVFLYENSKHFIWRRKQCHLFVHILYAIKLYYDSKRFTRNNDAKKEKVKTAMQQNCSKTLVNDYGYDITTMRNKS